MMVLPEFIIIGAQKCGTSALWHTITDHPDVGKTKKEKRFFNKHFHKGLPHYSSMFIPGKINGDASPDYLISDEVPNRLCKTVPDVKLIVSFRNPTERAYSQYQHNKPKIGLATFEEELAIREEYIARGEYAKQMKRWLQFFPLEQFLFIKFEDFRLDNKRVFEEVGKFIGIDLKGYAAIERYKPYDPMKESTKKRLDKHFKPLNEDLYNMLNIDFQW